MMTFHKPTQWQPILKGNQLTRAPCHPSRYEKGKEHNVQENIMKLKKDSIQHIQVLQKSE